MSIDTEIEGNPESIWATADWVRDSLASGIDNGADKIMKARNDADSGWEGTASENFREQMTSGGGKADDFADAAREMAQKFEDIGGALKHAHREMDSVRGDAAAAGLQVDGAVIAHPGEAPPDPGSAPTGRDATAEAHQAHNDAVAAVKAHQAKVEAYNKASDDAEDVRRTWLQAVDGLNDTSNEVGKEGWFTVADIAAGTTAAAASAVNRSILLRQAEFYRDDARQAMRHTNSYNSVVLDREGFYQQQDRAHASTRAADAAEERANRTTGRWGNVARVGGGALSIGGIAYDIHQGKDPAQAVTSGGASFAASLGAGAAAGTAIGGPVGTAVGAVVGAGVGVFTSGMVDSLWENGVGNVGDAIVDGGKAVADTGQAIWDGATSAGEAAGEVISDVGSAAAEGVKDAWDSIF